MQTEQLQRSFFYPACGLDLQPLLRFSHLCDTFIFADWNMEAAEVEQGVARLLQQNPYVGRLELQGSPEVVREADLGGRPPIWPLNFRLTEQEDQAYRRRLRQVRAPANPWARRFALTRVIDGIRRNLTLLFLGAEGLATYSALYDGSGCAPLVLCTIQSGLGFGCGWAELEEPRGVMERFLTACGHVPRIWLRGTWGYELGLDDHGNSQWNTVVQEYNGWNRSLVEAVICADDALRLQAEVVLQGADRQVRLQRAELHAEHVNQFDGCFVNQSFAGLGGPANQRAVYRWPLQMQSTSEWLVWIEQTCQEHGLERVVSLPHGYEDESVLINEWVNRPCLPRSLEIRFRGDLDYADLRGWPAA